MRKKLQNWSRKMAETRTPREQDTRAEEAREESYVPPSTLPVPNPEPGFSFHWVATHILGAADPTNVSMKLRDGWTPVKATDHPEMQIAGGASGNIEIGGLMLCKMPTKRYLARKAYYEAQARQQMQSVDTALMKNNDPRMPIFVERKSKTTRGENFGNGS
jgi:hypothetical protein